MDRLLNRTVEVHRQQAGVDRYGNSAGTWAKVTDIRARIEETPGAENVEDQEATQETARMWTRSDVVGHADRIVSGAETWEVAGEPVRRERAVGVHHYEVALRRWEP